MPLPGIYRCDRVRKINGSWEYFFVKRSGDGEEYCIKNIRGETPIYEHGKFYEIPLFKKAFPH
jgi:hypothetical protein